VGSGRDFDYAEAGFTHHSNDVKPIINHFPNLQQFFPENTEELGRLVRDFVYLDSPAFLSLTR
jgi:hypothetical protein